MARIRTVKPEFWTDVKTGSLSPVAQCLFLGILNHCDDYGVISSNSREHSARILPYLANSFECARNALVDELLPSGLVRLFTYQEGDDSPESYLWVRNFEKHQRVDKPGKSLIPGWKKGDTLKGFADKGGHGFLELSENPRDYSQNVPESSPAEGKGKEGKGKEGKGSTGKSAELESSARIRPEDLFLTILTNQGTEFAITENKIDEWYASYPNVDVRQKVRALRQWCIDNPNRRKTARGMHRFVSGRLAADQDRGSGNGKDQRGGEPNRPRSAVDEVIAANERARAHESDAGPGDVIDAESTRLD